jgi:hypothetical protein
MHVVLIHGWSVTHTNTYGGLPEALSAQPPDDGDPPIVGSIGLGRYVSFRDEITMRDVIRALDQAFVDYFDVDQLADLPSFACITHSTGGPVVREWCASWNRRNDKPCPLTHNVMLAPPNHGSALAVLGASRIGRIKAWFGRKEPGDLILRWLELGSREQWALNSEYLFSAALPDDNAEPRSTYQFVLSGQTIDPKLYDHLNSYTGEKGSDGVVRLAAANLNYRFVQLEQMDDQWPDRPQRARLEIDPDTYRRSPTTPFLVIADSAHSGKRKGIMRSVKIGGPAKPVVAAIRRCMAVKNQKQYEDLTLEFAEESSTTQEAEKIDRCSMVSFQFEDDQGDPLTDYDMLLLGGSTYDPNKLPPGFFVDRQRNRREPNKLVYYLSYDRMRELTHVGIRIVARPQGKLAGYVPAEFRSQELPITDIIRPNETTMVKLVLKRLVDREVGRIDSGTQRRSFTRVSPSGEVVP